MTVRQDIRIRQGETWFYQFMHPGGPIDLTTYQGRMTIRSTFGRAMEAFLSTGNTEKQGTITFNATGMVMLSMTADQTQALLYDVFNLLLLKREDTFKYERWTTMIYDLEIIATDGIVTRLIQGNLHVERGVRTL